MESCGSDDVTFVFQKKGILHYTKASYPVRYGIFSLLTTKKAVYLFNLNGEIHFAQGLSCEWPDRQEWLKRNASNEWIYYSTGGYTGVFEVLGEYYLPNFQYSTNSLLGGNPFDNSAVSYLLSHWYEDVAAAVAVLQRLPNCSSYLRAEFAKIEANTPEVLAQKAKVLSSLIGGQVTVLPPDARHVEYDVVPVTAAAGCLYKCGFCRVKNKHSFREMTAADIEIQLSSLRSLYGQDLQNYNSVFLGEHDALACNGSFFLQTVEQVYEGLALAQSYMAGVNFFSFASVDALLGKDLSFYRQLNGLPVRFYLNVGLESADQRTLDFLQKPLTARSVRDAFSWIRDIMRLCPNLEISVNFVLDERLPASHLASYISLVQKHSARVQGRGTIYFSPLRFSSPSRELVAAFLRLKLISRFPTYLYIIQRL